MIDTHLNESIGNRTGFQAGKIDTSDHFIKRSMESAVLKKQSNIDMTESGEEAPAPNFSVPMLHKQYTKLFCVDLRTFVVCILIYTSA